MTDQLELAGLEHGKPCKLLGLAGFVASMGNVVPYWAPDLLRDRYTDGHPHGRMANRPPRMRKLGDYG